MTPFRQNLFAYHEARNDIVGTMTPDYYQVEKTTIIPRSFTGRLTFYSPDEQRVDSNLYYRQYIEGQLAAALGDRIREELVFWQRSGQKRSIQWLTTREAGR